MYHNTSPEYELKSQYKRVQIWSIKKN